MSAYNFTPEQIRALNEFLDEGKMQAFEDGTLKTLFAFSDALRRKTMEMLYSERRAHISSQKKVERFESRLQAQAETGDFLDLGFDSLDIARCLLYYLQRLKTYNLNKRKVIFLLYEAYCSWLTSKRERICIERPVATELGPWFWRVSQKINVSQACSAEDVKKIAERNPGLRGFLENVARKYYDYSESQLKDYLLRSHPYKNALPDKNKGKWNKTIEDSDIFMWKENKV